ncbi:hypothetical protein [Planktothrix paucivesiculata]|uniref:Uncharacterized protein n=1 Tax=Planktothrix paucivesiculata PCC 9631 TaxID=671071 RepID=A0A7Z9DY88_9CYAN|nr:hypothetical protein [Planktothrix paucivesiculata]VXD15488.1 conserved hypothetical protein [Planktothrix paucivesiculata PCC 9631]VXD24365.1 conserved hypothetical protein [Planktothrix paucivesiculata PCC 9631]
MKITVAISGSRSITILNPESLTRINKIIELNYEILIGDAPGVDLLVQTYLDSVNYDNVQVWFAFSTLRNNVGNWGTVKVQGSYSLRDKLMHQQADFGLAIWDGKSPGTKRNIQQLGKRCRVVLIN